MDKASRAPTNGERPNSFTSGAGIERRSARRQGCGSCLTQADSPPPFVTAVASSAAVENMAAARRGEQHLCRKRHRANRDRRRPPLRILVVQELQMSDTHPQVGETYEVTPDSLTRDATGVHQKVRILSGRFWTTKLPAYRWCGLIAGHSQPAWVTSTSGTCAA